MISTSEIGDLSDDDAGWLTAYSKVSGELPPGDYPAGETVFVRGFVNVLVAGTARLQINSVDELTLWVDGKPINDLTDPIKLQEGRRTLTFKFSPARRESGLRVELKAIDGRGKFQPEGGL